MCLANLIEFSEDVNTEDVKGRALHVIYVDFRKAFDKVPHGRLLWNVGLHGIHGELADWIQKRLHG